VNQGNSGGPTFDVNGRVIGVNTAIFSPSGGSIGIAFAIPAETVKTVVAQLRDKGTVVRGWVGVQIQPVTADIAESLGLKKPEGVLVAEPMAGSPAAKAGLAAGDVIISLNSEPVKDARELSRRIGDMAPGTQIKLGLTRRGGQAKTVTVTLGELPGQSPRASVEPPAAAQPRGTKADLGLTLAPAGKVDGAGQRGVVVIEADPNGSAAGQGIETGDVILEVAGKNVASPAEVAKAVADARRAGKSTVLMRVRSGEASRFVAVPVG
jgi:serine protease Do